MAYFALSLSCRRGGNETAHPVHEVLVVMPDDAIIKARRLVPGLYYKAFRPPVSISVGKPSQRL
jgi:hypothetical protein